MSALPVMKAPSIILGDPNSILRLPKSTMLRPNEWTQMDSDILAHFLQVNKQIQDSRWYRAKVSFRTQGGQPKDCSIPEFEDFVFAAVYLRQLIAEKDSLLDDAVGRYCRFVDCQIRPIWVHQELAAFNCSLDHQVHLLTDIAITTRELFDAFMYGAALLHKMPKVEDTKRKRFLEIYDNIPRHVLLYVFHMSLKMLMNHIGAVASVICRDYSYWLRTYGLPPPDTRWHERLFEVIKAEQSDTPNHRSPSEPVVGGR